MEKLYLQSLSNLKEKNKKLNELYEEFEKDLDIIGVTAVEDCLQDFLSKIIIFNLEPTLKSFREIGIKVWMLTGDNPFTAVNIAHSCGLIEKNQKTFIVHQKSRKEIKEEFEKIRAHIKKNKKRQKSDSNNYFISNESNGNEYISSSDSSANSEKIEFCLVITGDVLTMVKKDQMRVDANNNENDENKNNNKNEKNNNVNEITEKNENKNKKGKVKKKENEEDLEIKPMNKNPLSSPENRSGSEKSNDTIEDFKIKKEYKDTKIYIAGEQKDYNADSENENSNNSKSINSNSYEKLNNSREKNKSKNKKEERSYKSISKKEENKNKNQIKESSKNFDNEGTEEDSLLNLFLEIITSTNTVICSRVSPKQKADLIVLVKKHEKENMTTLAIGDGANDVNMITAADVGIGIMGNEGQQAARASDYVIGQFSFLKRLLFVHGREAQRKNAFAIGYILWKNFLYVIPMIM